MFAKLQQLTPLSRMFTISNIVRFGVLFIIFLTLGFLVGCGSTTTEGEIENNQEQATQNTEVDETALPSPTPTQAATPTPAYEPGQRIQFFAIPDKSRLTSVNLNKDETMLLATASGSSGSACLAGCLEGIWVWDVETSTLLYDFTMEVKDSGLTTGEWSEDGTAILISSRLPGIAISLLDPDSQSLIPLEIITDSYPDARWNEDETLIIAKTDYGSGKVWESGEAIFEWEGDRFSRILGWSANEDKLVISGDENISIIDATDGNIIQQIPSVEQYWNFLINNNTHLLSLGDERQSFQVWDLESLTPVIDSSFDYSLSLSPSLDGNYFAAGGKEDQAMLKLWDISTGEVVFESKDQSFLSGISWSPNQPYVASGSFDGSMKVWNFETGEEIQSFNSDEPITNALWSEDGTLILAFFDKSNDGDYSFVFTDGLRVWDVATGETTIEIENEGWGIEGFWHPNKNWLLVYYDNPDTDPILQVLDASSGETILTVDLEQDIELERAFWNEDGSRIIIVQEGSNSSLISIIQGPQE